MKIKNGFVLRDVGGQAVVIAVGEASKTFHGMINLNATGKEIWQGIESGLDVDQMVEKMVETYEVEPDKAREDIQAMVDKMKKCRNYCRIESVLWVKCYILRMH